MGSSYTPQLEGPMPNGRGLCCTCLAFQAVTTGDSRAPSWATDTGLLLLLPWPLCPRQHQGSRESCPVLVHGGVQVGVKQRGTQRTGMGVLGHISGDPSPPVCWKTAPVGVLQPEPWESHTNKLLSSSPMPPGGGGGPSLGLLFHSAPHLLCHLALPSLHPASLAHQPDTSFS